jgi:hypothetical protein
MLIGIFGLCTALKVGIAETPYDIVSPIHGWLIAAGTAILILVVLLLHSWGVL